MRLQRGGRGGGRCTTLEADELQAKVCGWKAGIKGEEVQCCVPRWLLHACYRLTVSVDKYELLLWSPKYEY